MVRGARGPMLDMPVYLISHLNMTLTAAREVSGKRKTTGVTGESSDYEHGYPGSDYRLPSQATPRHKPNHTNV